MKKKKLAFTCLVKPFSRIWTRAKAYWLGCTRNPTTRVSPLVKTHAEPSSTIGLSHPSFASAHSYGFTLAEVLITLTILGAVAAITVPTLQKQNYKRTQISRMAKGYASLEKAAANIAANTNCIGKDLECTKLFDITDKDEFQNKFAELANFRVSKKYSGYAFYPKPLKYETDKTAKFSAPYGFKVFVTTPDNIAYSVFPITTFEYTDSKGKNQLDKAIQVIVFTDKSQLYDSSGNVIINYVNGGNDAIFGRSAFMFLIYDNFKVEPGTVTWYGTYRPISTYGGCQQAKISCDPNTTSKSWDQNGFSCAARIICDGWKMNY